MYIYYTELETNNIDKITSHHLLEVSLVKYWERFSAEGASCVGGIAKPAGDTVTLGGATKHVGGEHPEICVIRLNPEEVATDLKSVEPQEAVTLARNLVAGMTIGEYGKPEFLRNKSISVSKDEESEAGERRANEKQVDEKRADEKSTDELRDAVQQTDGGACIEYPIPHFSISHSGNVWAVLFSRQECGLDIQFEVECKHDKLASRIYGAEEAKLIQSLIGNDKIEEFFKHWTCREAYIKALGISVFRDAEGEGMNCEGESVSTDGRRWKVYNISFPLELYAAVCVRC